MSTKQTEPAVHFVIGGDAAFDLLNRCAPAFKGFVEQSPKQAKYQAARGFLAAHGAEFEVHYPVSMVVTSDGLGLGCLAPEVVK